MKVIQVCLPPPWRARVSRLKLGRIGCLCAFLVSRVVFRVVLVCSTLQYPILPWLGSKSFGFLGFCDDYLMADTLGLLG